MDAGERVAGADTAADSERLLLTGVGGRPGTRGTAGGTTPGLPDSLLRQAARRLQAVSLVMFIVLGVTWFGVQLVEGELAHELTTPGDWVPPVIAIVASLLMFVIARSSWLTAPAIITLGLAYEVVVSWTMPFSQYWGAFRGLSGNQLTSDVVGVSGVALWMLFFTVLVPARPRDALIALTLSGSAAPITMGVLIRMGDAPALGPMRFFFIFVGPYLTTIFLAYVAARVVFGLGRDVGRAQEMGSYRLLGLIGRGGMGEVWRARHNMLARPAAIKLIRRDALGTSPGARQATLERFEREAQVTAGLQSPYTVGLYDFGVSEDGSLYYVMELLDGVDLETLVKRFGPLPAERVVHILRQACRSLVEAHRRGLVHRDIKPSNIYLCEHAFEHDFVKVLDFGLVKRLAAAGKGDDAMVTHTQFLAGTPAYIAPELALDREPIDGRADIYSLGCVAFWLLTGRRVFEESSPVAMILAHTSAAPPRPGACAKQPVPPELDAAVLACLEKDPVKRIASAGDLDDRLAAIAFESPWTGERAAQWWRSASPAGS